MLPNAAPTNFHVMVNFAEMLHICDVRLCVRAQWEIRRMVAMMRAEIKAQAARNRAVPAAQMRREPDGLLRRVARGLAEVSDGQGQTAQVVLFELYNLYGSQKVRALSENEYHAVEEKELL